MSARSWMGTQSGEASGHRSELYRTSAEICGFLMHAAEEILVARLLQLHSSPSRSGCTQSILAVMQMQWQLPLIRTPSARPFARVARTRAPASVPHGSYSCFRATIVLAPVLDTTHNSTINDDRLHHIKVKDTRALELRRRPARARLIAASAGRVTRRADASMTRRTRHLARFVPPDPDVSRLSPAAHAPHPDSPSASGKAVRARTNAGSPPRCSRTPAGVIPCHIWAATLPRSPGRPRV